MKKTQKVDVECLREGTVGEGVNRIQYDSYFYLKFQELIQTKSLYNYQQSSKTSMKVHLLDIKKKGDGGRGDFFHASDY